ncbi:hypothetical protein O0L34_g16193 [Tuta absoluta]|nr:hypothetical protein O0L34_g16193 [Tuta absoluta]
MTQIKHNKNPIGTKSFIPREHEIYCTGCYEDKFATRCVKCNKVITPLKHRTLAKHNMARIKHNKNPIGTKSFIPREQEIYCAGCYEDKFATRCVKCNKVITPTKH